MDFYHVLNRGVDKRKIFMNESDYIRFIHDLFEFNDEDEVFDVNYRYDKGHFNNLNLQNRRKRKLLVNIHCFAAMPNHYHLLLSPLVDDGIPLFMRKLNGGYSRYFNNKYKRSGALFQGRYKSVYIDNDRHLMFIPYYIHFNPLDLKYPGWRRRELRDANGAIQYLEDYRWSSLPDYLGRKNFPSVTQRDILLEHFGSGEDYAKIFARELKNFSESGFEEITLE